MADLSALLEKEASAEIEAILSEARGRASEIVAQAKEEADALVAARERSAAGQREAALVRARSSAQLEAASLKLRAQHQGVQAVYAGARDALRALTEDRDRYAEVFGRLLADALEAVRGSQVASINVAEGDVELARKALAGAGVEAEVEASDAVAGGVRVRTTKNNVVENTLLGRLDAVRDELASEVSALLFADETAD